MQMILLSSYQIKNKILHFVTNILKIRTPEKSCCTYPKIGRVSYYRVIGSKDEDGIANNVDPDQTKSRLIWVCIVCPDLSDKT